MFDYLAPVVMAQQLALELGASTEIGHPEEAEVPVIWPEGSVPITGGRTTSRRRSNFF